MRNIKPIHVIFYLSWLNDQLLSLAQLYLFIIIVYEIVGLRIT